MTKILRGLLLLSLLAVSGLEAFLVFDQILELVYALVPLVLVAAGISVLFFRFQSSLSLLVSAFLGSASVLTSGISQVEWNMLTPGTLGVAASLLWTSFLYVMPSLFFHFALVFPIKSALFEQFPRLPGLLYLLPALLLVASQAERTSGIADQFLWLFPLSLAAGMAIFVRQYFYTLTDPERLRLRLILIGCLAGIVPRVIYLVAPDQFPGITNQLSAVLLALFPLGLLVSLQKENLAEIHPRIQQLIVAGVTVAAWIATSFLLFLVAVLLFPALTQTAAFAAASAGSLLLVFPVGRHAKAFLTGRSVRKSPPERYPRHFLFERIQPNPFIVGNPVRLPEMFFGRQAEFRFIQSTLRTQRQGCIIVLAGERRTGKTSILFQVLNGKLGGEYRPVFLDMQGVVAESDPEFLEILAAEFEKVDGQKSPRFSDFTKTSNPYTAFRDFVRELQGATPAERLLVLVDEYELIEDRIQAGRLSPDVPRFLNSLLESIPGLSFVFTGSRPFESRPLWHELMGKSFYREISFLERSDAEDLISKPLAGRVVFAGQTLDEFLRLAAGHPYFTQLLGQNLVDTLNELGRGLVDAEAVDRVVLRILEHPPPQMLYLWSGLADSQKLVLSGLAGLLESSSSYVSWAKVQSVLNSIPHERTRALDMTRTRMELEGLRRQRLLDRDQQRYRFTMDLLRRWIAAEHSVWSVLAQFPQQS